MGIAIGLFLWMAQEDDRITIVLDDAKKIRMEFVRIMAGKFTMGDEDNGPIHEVTISKDYWMQTTETTQAQWAAVMGKNPSGFEGADLPVETVTWEECQEFLKKLNERVEDQLKGKTAGLPTEAQWEYSCRAGSTGKWCFGDDEKRLGIYAWPAGGKTHPVGQKKPNAWGLYDMHGNVGEWCEDWYGEYPSEPVRDPTGPAEGKDRRVRRGGCWYYIDVASQSAVRDSSELTDRDSGVGLRVALR